MPNNGELSAIEEAEEPIESTIAEIAQKNEDSLQHLGIGEKVIAQDDIYKLEVLAGILEEELNHSGKMPDDLKNY